MSLKTVNIVTILICFYYLSVGHCARQHLHMGYNNLPQSPNLHHCSSLDSTQKLSQNFAQILESGRFSDVSLIVGNDTKKEFCLHKNIFYFRCPSIGAMLEAANQTVLLLPDESPEVFEQFVRFLYLGRVDKIEQFAEKLMAFADKYQMDCLKFLCLQHLKNITPHSVTSTLQFPQFLFIKMWSNQIFSSLVIFGGGFASTPPPNEPVCGVKGPHSSLHQDGLGIIGGDDAAPFEFPWQAALRSFDTLCGASILNNRWAITTGRCVTKGSSTEPDDASEYELFAGILKFRGHTDEPRTVVHVEQFFLHPKYAIGGDGYSQLNDIALLKLKEALPLSDPAKHLAPICLPKEQDEKYDLDKLAGTVCTTTGWGSKHPGGKLSEYLQRVNVTIQKQASCAKAYSEFGAKVDTGMICAVDAGKGTCDTDLGDPLICYSDNKWHLVGLNSWGFNCADPSYPDVYTRVTKFLPWIWETMANN